MTIPAGQLRLLPSGRGTKARYRSLLLILVVTYLLSAFTVSWLVSAVQVVLFLTVVLIALSSGRFKHKTGQFIAVGLLIGSVIAVILQSVDSNGPGGAVASLWTALILTLAVFFIVRQILSAPQITEQSIYGALSAYMMIGLIFAAVYVAMWRFDSSATASCCFFAHGASDNTKTFQYFSFTTLTTLGYGDFTAATDAGRAVAVLEAMVGQMFLATLVARLVAGFRWSDRAAARHSSQPAVPAAVRGPQASGPGPDAGPGESHSGTPLPPAGSRAAAPGPSRAKKASAPGLVRLSPPGTVRGRAGPRPGARKGTGPSGPVPSSRPAERD